MCNFLIKESDDDSSRSNGKNHTLSVLPNIFHSVTLYRKQGCLEALCSASWVTTGSSSTREVTSRHLWPPEASATRSPPTHWLGADTDHSELLTSQILL